MVEGSSPSSGVSFITLEDYFISFHFFFICFLYLFIWYSSLSCFSILGPILFFHPPCHAVGVEFQAIEEPTKFPTNFFPDRPSNFFIFAKICCAAWRHVEWRDLKVLNNFCGSNLRVKMSWTPQGRNAPFKQALSEILNKYACVANHFQLGNNIFNINPTFKQGQRVHWKGFFFVCVRVCVCVCVWGACSKKYFCIFRNNFVLINSCASRFSKKKK